ncbi:MAG: hypothetical protein AABX93_03135 [Nanoarchaeota archaeon]
MPDYILFINGTKGDYISDAKHPVSRIELISNAKDLTDALLKAEKIKSNIEKELFLPHLEIERLILVGETVYLRNNSS